MSIVRSLVVPIAGPVTAAPCERGLIHGGPQLHGVPGMVCYYDALYERSIATKVHNWPDLACANADGIQLSEGNKPTNNGLFNANKALLFNRSNSQYFTLTGDPLNFGGQSFLFGFVAVSTVANITQFFISTRTSGGGSSGWSLAVHSGTSAWRMIVNADAQSWNVTENGAAGGALVESVNVGFWDASVGRMVFWAGGGAPEMDGTSAVMIDYNFDSLASVLGKSHSGNYLSGTIQQFAAYKSPVPFKMEAVNWVGGEMAERAKLPWGTATI